MEKIMMRLGMVFILALPLLACSPKTPDVPVSRDTVSPGTTVTFRGSQYRLLGTPLEVGKPLPSATLVNAATMEKIDLSRERGTVLLLSIVPSIDTRVCEAQTHYLGEQGDKLPAAVRKVTISRDTPFAQKRFAEEAKLRNILYLSDHRLGEFGQAGGLLIDDLFLLARSVVIVDEEGIVRYVQVVPEITNLPDMEKAFARAVELVGK